MPSALRQLSGITLVYSLPDHASALWDRIKKDSPDDFFRAIKERDAQNNIDRDEEVSWRVAEYKCLMWLADYLISNGKTLNMYALPDLETYCDSQKAEGIRKASLTIWDDASVTSMFRDCASVVPGYYEERFIVIWRQGHGFQCGPVTDPTCLKECYLSRNAGDLFQVFPTVEPFTTSASD
ncbi:Helitron helicase-like protein [Phytophthora palmivora]|uniref:Helitron helicase-like protein n=1 Tax=Phytophthora palmivora TaxID=4796 RepID=A0A2P4Y2J7_9STRA|nr:Helitron helicase-like protein [Phytophthora palmivora]